MANERGLARAPHGADRNGPQFAVAYPAVQPVQLVVAAPELVVIGRFVDPLRRNRSRSKRTRRQVGEGRRGGRCAAAGRCQALKQDLKRRVIAVADGVEERPDMVVGLEVLAPLLDGSRVGEGPVALQRQAEDGNVPRRRTAPEGPA